MKKPIYKKPWFWAIVTPPALLVLFVIITFGVGVVSGVVNVINATPTPLGYIAQATASPTPYAQTSSPQATEIETPTSQAAEAETATPEPTQSGVIGDYVIEIAGARLAKDYKDRPTIVVTYAFTNNSSEAKSLMYACRRKAFQDGVELETAISVDGVSTANSMKDIKTGITLECEWAYLLSSESDIEIEIDALFSLNSDNAITEIIKYDILK